MPCARRHARQSVRHQHSRGFLPPWTAAPFQVFDACDLLETENGHTPSPVRAFFEADEYQHAISEVASHLAVGYIVMLPVGQVDSIWNEPFALENRFYVLLKHFLLTSTSLRLGPDYARLQVVAASARRAGGVSRTGAKNCLGYK